MLLRSESNTYCRFVGNVASSQVLYYIADIHESAGFAELLRHSIVVIEFAHLLTDYSTRAE
jgi:hypothetical protein